MKKTMMILACLMMLGMQSMKAQVAIAALHHNDSVEIYPAAQIQTAIDAAVAGDTIYLSEGMFGGFTVTKPIAIIGAGQTTSISSNITIGKSGATLEDGLILSGLNIIRDVSFQNIVDGVRIFQCKILGNCSFSHLSSSNFTNIEILMSHIVGTLDFYGGYNNTRVQGITVANSKIGKVNAAAVDEGGSTFLNCNINELPSGNIIAKHNNYVNCIIRNAHGGIFKNCLCCDRGTETYTTYVDCFFPSSVFMFNDNLDSPYSDDELRQAGYLGIDGTVVGVTGGDVPFTLVTSILQVTEHNLEVDNVERKLKVSLKLGNK